MAKSFTVESRMTPPPCDPPALDYPVTPKENLKLLLDGKIPYWVPMMGLDHQMTACPGDNDRPPYGTSGKDWFGVSWTYVDTVGGQTVSPNSFIMEDMSQWREKFIFPDLDKIDFSQGREEAAAKCNPNKPTGYVMQDGLFERLLSLCPTEECLAWMVEEPEDAADFFNAMADYKIAMVHKLMKEWVPLDILINSDDWGTQLSTFMAPETFRELIAPPMKRIADVVRSYGVYYICHSCGKCQALAPDMVDIGFCMWETQNMNDHRQVQKDTNGRLNLQVTLDPYVLQDPDLTEERLRQFIRDTIDRLGRNGGLALAFKALTPMVYRTAIDEIFHYSRSLYAGREGQPTAPQLD